MDASNRSARTAQRRLWTAGIAACLLATVACGERRAGGKVQSETSGGGQPETGNAPRATAETAHGAAAAPTNSTSTAVDSTVGRSDSSRARQVARAPRANPSAPAPAGSTKAKPDTQSAAAASPPLRDAYHQPPKDTVSQQVYNGWKQFNLNCARCHGEDVMGTTIAPHLIDSFRSGKVDHTEFWNVVHGSRMQKGMPNWSGIIPDDQLEAIYQYVKGRSDGKIGPGRPAVKGG
jgi:mono/diheme cytochrome c family protein